MKKKTFVVFCSFLVLVIALSFKKPAAGYAYKNGYLGSVSALDNGLNLLQASLRANGKNRNYCKTEIHKCRRILKAADIWLRYFAPATYKLLNGPLPVEWETEVFEKSEKPYRRPGAGLSLAELYLDEKNYSADSLVSLISTARKALDVYRADSVGSQLNTADPFFFANRLFLLNLSALYTTGFECPDTSQIIPELGEMLSSVRTIYDSFDENFPDRQLGKQYLSLYDSTIRFVASQSRNFSAFDNFIFIRDYVNRLFALNQQMILQYKVSSVSFNDYTLNDDCMSIFDKSLFRGQNYKGVFSMVTDEKAIAELSNIGKMLFYDPILSGNNKRSCVSCHKPDEYFADTSSATNRQFDRSLSLPRNTPSLVGAVFQHLLMLDGRITTLQKQAKAVTTNPVEMGGNEKDIMEKVLSCRDYRKAFTKFLKYTPGYKEVTMDHIVSAITLFYGPYSYCYSPFDDAMNRKKQADAELVRGFNLFMSKAQCATCHYVPEFNGVRPPFVGSEFEVIGVPKDTSYQSLSADMGRGAIYPSPEMEHAFRTNTVRNAQYTKPYMYNGIFCSLSQVIEFYNAGGGKGKGLQVDNQTLSSDSLKLSPAEKKSLLYFISSLNEKIPVTIPPLSLPLSSNKAYNERKIGGEY